MITVLAENNFGDTMSDGLAGPMGLLIIVLLAIATALLIRSMNRHLRRIPERFPNQPAEAGRAAGPGEPAAVSGAPAEVAPERAPGNGGRAATGGGSSPGTGGSVDGLSGEV
jgi:hypothetical protein